MYLRGSKRRVFTAFFRSIYFRDGKNGAATANVVLRARNQAEIDNPGMISGDKTELPFVLYDEGSESGYAPTGWMGSTDAIALDMQCNSRPKSGKYCAKITYARGGDWGGVVWQNPPSDWGEKPGGFDLTGATKLTFWARGENGGEIVGFGFGLLGPEKAWPDSGKGEVKDVELKNEWTQYSIDLTGVDLRRIKSGFFWTVAGQGESVRFYLDQIRFE